MAEALWCPWRSAHPDPRPVEYVLIRFASNNEGAYYVMRFLCEEHCAEERSWVHQRSQPLYVEKYKPAADTYSPAWMLKKLLEVLDLKELELRFDDKGRAWL